MAFWGLKDIRCNVCKLTVSTAEDRFTLQQKPYH